MKPIAAIIVLWIPFSIAALLAVPVLLFSLLVGDEAVWRPVGRAMDCLLAALLGFSGTHTLSAELGVSGRLQWLCWVLDKIQANHCLNAAKGEGLFR